jgi:hypothetical protein
VDPYQLAARNGKRDLMLETENFIKLALHPPAPVPTHAESRTVEATLDA